MDLNACVTSIPRKVIDRSSSGSGVLEAAALVTLKRTGSFRSQVCLKPVDRFERRDYRMTAKVSRRRCLIGIRVGPRRAGMLGRRLGVRIAAVEAGWIPAVPKGGHNAV